MSEDVVFSFSDRPDVITETDIVQDYDGDERAACQAALYLLQMLPDLAGRNSGLGTVFVHRSIEIDGPIILKTQVCLEVVGILTARVPAYVVD